MKKVILLVISLVFVTFICSCDAGLRITGMKIDHYPDRIVYITGKDNSLDLSGGTICFNLKQGTDSTCDMNDRRISVSHKINFDIPGVYVVSLTNGEFVCDFPIQVIDNNYYKNPATPIS